MFTQLKVQLKLLFSNKMALLAMLALPLLLTFLLTKVDTGTVRETLYISDTDHSTASTQFISLLKRQSNLQIIEAPPQNVDAALANQKTDAAVKIEKGFSQNIANGNTSKIQVLQPYQSADSTLSVQEILQCYQTLSSIYRGAATAASELSGSSSVPAVKSKITANALRDDSEKSTISTSSFSANGTVSSGIDGVSNSLMGFLILFMGIVVIQGCRTLIDEKENRTYERMLATPSSFLMVLTVKTISIFLYSAINVAIILAAGRLLFHLEIFDKLLPLCSIFAAYLFAMIGITLVATLRASNQQMFTAIGLPVAVLTGMLGGCFFPLDVAPKAIRILSRFTPQGWALPAVTSINAANSNSVLLTTYSVLITAGIVFLIIFFLAHYFRLKLLSK